MTDASTTLDSDEWTAAAEANNVDIENGVVTITPPAGIIDSVRNHYPVDEGSGSTLNDNEDTADGTINGASWVSDANSVGGEHLLFNGTDNYVDFGTSSWDYTAQATFSVSAWIYPTGSNFRTVISKGTSTSSRGWNLRLSDTDTLQFVQPGDGAYGTLSIQPDTWQFVAALVDYGASEVTLIVDGTEEVLTIGAMEDPTGQPANIGRDNTDDRYFDGEMDEITLGDTLYSGSDLDELRSRR